MKNSIGKRFCQRLSNISILQKRDISVLTTIVTKDTSGIENALAHIIAQCYGTVLSTVLIFLSILAFNFKIH